MRRSSAPNSSAIGGETRPTFATYGVVAATSPSSSDEGFVPRSPATCSRGRDPGLMIAGAGRPARMAGCQSMTPTTCWPTSIRPSARPSRSPRGRCASWPAPGAARPGSSPGASPTPWPRSVVRPRDVLVVTFTDKAAGEMARRGWRTWGIGGSPRRPSMRPRSASCAISGRSSMAPTPPDILAVEGADPRPAGGGPAGRLSLSRGPRPRRRDRMGEGAPDRPRRVRAARHRERPGRPAAARPHGRALSPLRGGQDARRPDRLRGHARARRSPSSTAMRPSPPRSATGIAGSRSTSTRTPTRCRRRSSTPGWAGATTWPWSATRTRRSTRSPGPRATT